MKTEEYLRQLGRERIIGFIEDKFGKVTKYDLTVFLCQLEVLYNAGVPVVRALKLLIEQTTNQKFVKVLQEVRRDIERGGTFSGSAAKFPAVFKEVEVSVIRVGEVVGDLGIVLKRLSEYEKKELDLARRIQSAMIYPLIVFSCALLLIICLAQFLFGNLLPVLEGQGLELGLATRIIMFIITFFRHPAVLVSTFIVLAGVSYLARDLFQSPAFIQMKDRTLWRLPLFGMTLKKVALARFCSNVSLLHENGVSMIRLLTTIADSCGHTLLRIALYQTVEYMKEGQPLWRSLKSAAIFPSSLIHMVSIGESSGKLSECLKKLADFYESEVNYSVQNLSAALEPIMISVMGIFVGGIIFIALSPLYKLIASFGY